MSDTEAEIKHGPRLEVLEVHGTVISTLKPINIVQAAQEDLKRKIRNKAQHGSGTYEHYAFHRLHVKKAESASQIIGNAIAENEPGAASGKKQTRLIYRDKALLDAAYVMAVNSD